MVLGDSGDRRTVRETVCSAAAGAAAGALGPAFVCPLDVIKTRLQVYGLPETRTSGRRDSVIIVSLQQIVRNEGLKGLYCGLTPTVAASLLNWAVYFSVYGNLKGLLHSYEGNMGHLTVASNMMAAAGAGAATIFATNPLWVVKTRLQTQGMKQNVVPYKSVFSALSRITHEEGFRGLYSGLIPSLAGISHVAIQLPTFERIKLYLAERDNRSSNELNPGEVAVASFFSKVVASVLTYPHEVVRTKMQEQGHVRKSDLHYTGVIDCIKKLLKKAGIPGFYRGCATNLMRTTPSAVITFTSYEMIHRFLLRVSSPEEKHAELHPKPNENDSIKSNQGTTPLHQSVSPSPDDRTHLIPLGNTDKLT